MPIRWASDSQWPVIQMKWNVAGDDFRDERCAGTFRQRELHERARFFNVLLIAYKLLLGDETITKQHAKPNIVKDA